LQLDKKTLFILLLSLSFNHKMKQKSRKYFGFTMIELLTVTVIIGLLMPSIVAIYSFLIKSNREFTLRQNAIQQWYEFFERLNILMQDYTVDYEEYYNRQMVWCIWDDKKWDNFEWNIWKDWHCTNFTAYGNENSTERYNLSSTTYHDIYHCSTEVTSTQNLKKDRHKTVKSSDCWTIWNRQSFGQYKTFFIDFHGYLIDRDDEDKWTPINESINWIADGNNIQELYLISHDWKRRLYFRRKFIQENWELTQYKIQMLRLRWFDAGQNHDFDHPSEWLYDRQIDTWACDTSMWFVWQWNSIWWAYDEYHLPKDNNDCRIDLSYWNTTVTARNISISPLNDPDLYWAAQDKQLNPYMKILVVNGVYLPTYLGNSITEFKVPIQTTINMKDFYKE